LTLRDHHSVKSLIDLHVEVGPDRVYPDLAFGLPRPADESPRSGCVGVGLINYFDWRGSPAEKAANRTKYEGIMIDLVGWLLDEGYSVRLLTGDIWDDPYLQRVLDAVRSSHPDLGPERLVGEPARNLHELMRHMQDVEVVIGARFHNIITALRLAKPILALSYAPKATQVMELFGVSSFDHRLDEIDIPRLQQQFRELYHGRDEIGRRLRIAFGSVEDRLKAQEESFVSEFLLNLVPAGA
jgi:polysaccharide pyruvyl transferase WcaK-like protein